MQQGVVFFLCIALVLGCITAQAKKQITFENGKQIPVIVTYFNGYNNIQEVIEPGRGATLDISEGELQAGINYQVPYQGSADNAQAACLLQCVRPGILDATCTGMVYGSSDAIMSCQVTPQELQEQTEVIL